MDERVIVIDDRNTSEGLRDAVLRSASELGTRVIVATPDELETPKVTAPAEMHKTHIAAEATSAPQLRPVTVAEVAQHRKSNCPHCVNGIHMVRSDPLQKDATPFPCGCAIRRFTRKHGDDVEWVERDGQRLVFWKPGRRGATAVNL